MKISIGTPPFTFLAIADTGSDLIWTQCKPCIHCFKQENPLFDPKSSSTYNDIPCPSNKCSMLKITNCSGSHTYIYTISYGDGSRSQGNLAVDTLTLDSTNGHAVAFLKTIIGCGYINGGSFTEEGLGMVRLNDGPVSLTTQLDSSINEKFSYFLVPDTSQSK